ncbi:hypothetical protein [Desulfobacca acetoxidans]|uniref:Uncharacterized protein n=1 Tax=Desulfobacca acetoxidans (strain ATCC 700848 / DSM 11109 / ASRB2) TaxID=880072 RepID=F2NHT6_DESAR|nr:hypothetical protein [Desulfobacca acetoxidans]AEB09421.1 hypothetical protein Desac_1567 [Desulfobacca acetoxidans DSM 11109]
MNSATPLIKAFRINAIISGAMLGSLFLYAVIVEVFRYRHVTPPFSMPSLLENLRLVFVFLSFAVYFMINFFRKRILVKQLEDTPEVLIRKLSMAHLISLALAELPAVFGLLLFLLSGISRDYYLLMVLSIALFYIYFPRYSFWEAWSKVNEAQSG